MHYIALLAILISFSIHAHFPKENYIYKPNNDVGYTPYLAQSLYGTKKVVLTYDDGPTPGVTEHLLDVLKAHDAKATFFIIASRITPTTLPIIQRMVNEGHIVASHSYAHKISNTLSEEAFKLDLIKSVTMVRTLLTASGFSQYGSYFRFPGGAYGNNASYHHINTLLATSKEIFQENCINIAFWDIGIPDYCTQANSTLIYDALWANLIGGNTFTCDAAGVITTKPITSPLGGGIVLMHDSKMPTVLATEKFLETAKEKGVQIIPLNNVENFSFVGKSCRF